MKNLIKRIFMFCCPVCGSFNTKKEFHGYTTNRFTVTCNDCDSIIKTTEIR